MQKSILTFILLLTPAWLGAKTLPLQKLNLPAGFEIAIYAEVPGARQMTHGGQGIIYVGSRRQGKVHAVVEKDGDYKADEVFVIAKNLKLPSGVAYRNGDLFVGAVNRILRYDDIDKALDQPPAPEIVTDKLPNKTHHGWKFIAFGPDGLLYIPVGAPCNICLSKNPQFASILRMDVDLRHSKLEIYARGIRNSVGFDWHPSTHELWFTDNGRDSLGDEQPPCELNRVTKQGQHFGYPYVHGHNVPDPKFGKDGKPSEYTQPTLALGPHVAPLGMMFYTGNMFPEKYRQQILVPEHGSWNRSPRAGHTGYRLTLAREVAGKLTYEVFIDGWLDKNNRSWGRPVHLLQMEDGSLLLSDDKAGVVYRISYK